jgi:succinate dehydrogenase/fumarate reductase flavoprotein subunit
VWLDTPMIDKIHGVGTLESRLPAMLRMYLKYDIDMRETPILVYPTLHYQNGGLEIDGDCESRVPGLYVAGEAAGGIHGRNRLMGNSLLDIIVFGRAAGKTTAAAVGGVKLGRLTLDHVDSYEKGLSDAGIDNGKRSPMLLPDYTRRM